MRPAYEAAAALYRLCGKKCTLHERPKINFIPHSRDFWYLSDRLDGSGNIQGDYVRYVFDRNAVEPLFDRQKLQEALKPYWEGESLEKQLQQVAFEGESSLYFHLKEYAGEFCYDTRTDTLTRLAFPCHAPDEATSPDHRWSVFLRDHNLHARDNQSGQVKQLTFDGCEKLDYGSRFLPVSETLLQKEPEKRKPAVVWSPDSRFFLTYRTDRRLLGELGLVQSVPKNGGSRPKHAEYPYAIPGDEHILEGQVYVGDMETGDVRKVLLDGEPVVLYLLAMFEAEGDKVKWTESTNEAYLVRYDRFFKTIRCILIDAARATAKVIREETYQTFGFAEYYGSASQEVFQDMSMRYLPDTRELLWHSELDGWSTLWLIDLETGEKKRRFTQDGECFRRLKYVDEKNRLVYFTAAGIAPDLDPYYQQLYVCPLDGGGRKLLSPEPEEHFISFQPEGAYYVDTHSTVQTLPATAVHSPDGAQRLFLAQADISLIKEYYLEPEPFEALARDGKTKIYGILIKPANFNPAEKYPVIDYIYGGAQKINTPKAFDFNPMPGYPPYGGLEYFGHLGFVGVIVDGLATPLRSKAIHDYIYGRAEECCGLEDHVAAIGQLGQRFPWLDTSRVGIWGASGGGYAAARAMLCFGDFYKVGVSLCGNHDQAIYHAHWGERWIGPYSEEAYHDQANYNFADKLQGKLLIVHGDVDDNVHPAASIKLISALMEAGKDFDCLLVPNSAHPVARVGYVVKRMWDYFVRYLMGEVPPEDFPPLTAVDNEKTKS